MKKIEENGTMCVELKGGIIRKLGVTCEEFNAVISENASLKVWEANNNTLLALNMMLDERVKKLEETIMSIKAILEKAV